MDPIQREGEGVAVRNGSITDFVVGVSLGATSEAVVEKARVNDARGSWHQRRRAQHPAFASQSVSGGAKIPHV